VARFAPGSGRATVPATFQFSRDDRSSETRRPGRPFSPRAGFSVRPTQLKRPVPCAGRRLSSSASASGHGVRRAGSPTPVKSPRPCGGSRHLRRHPSTRRSTDRLERVRWSVQALPGTITGPPIPPAPCAWPAAGNRRRSPVCMLLRAVAFRKQVARNRPGPRFLHEPSDVARSAATPVEREYASGSKKPGGGHGRGAPQNGNQRVPFNVAGEKRPASRQAAFRRLLPTGFAVADEAQPGPECSVELGPAGRPHPWKWLRPLADVGPAAPSGTWPTLERADHASRPPLPPAPPGQAPPSSTLHQWFPPAADVCGGVMEKFPHPIRGVPAETSPIRRPTFRSEQPPNVQVRRSSV